MSTRSSYRLADFSSIVIYCNINISTAMHRNATRGAASVVGKVDGYADITREIVVFG